MIAARLGAGALLVAAALLAASCAKPEIAVFSVDPHALCYGDTATVTWQVMGEGVLTAEPGIPGTGAVEESGSLRAAPLSDTKLMLTVKRRGKTAFARQEIVVLPSEFDTFLVITTVPGDSSGLAARVVIPPHHWHSSVRITSVLNSIDRMLEIRHEGRADTLAPGAMSVDFAGCSYGGEWVLEAPLLSGERIGDPQHAPPEFLRLDVHLKCSN